MNSVREYILTIIAASLVSGVLSSLLDKRGMPGSFGKLFCGLFLSICMINPLVGFSFDSITGWIESCGAEGERIVAEGEKMSADMIRENITAQCEAYILDEATRMGCQIQVSVELAQASPYPPVSVTIDGIVSPYCKASLNSIITEELAVEKENIQWK